MALLTGMALVTKLVLYMTDRSGVTVGSRILAQWERLQETARKDTDRKIHSLRGSSPTVNMIFFRVSTSGTGQSVMIQD